MNNSFLKGMIVVLVVIYIVSPIDACPGLVDDLIVFLLGKAAQKQLTKQEPEN